jgi:nitrogen fixation protein FixH
MREITGPKVFAFTASAFGVIIGVNVIMAYSAISTFPGLEVKSAYIASQTFDADRAAQQALGWGAVPSYNAATGTLMVRITSRAGQAQSLADVQVLVGRSTEAREDFTPIMTYENGAYTAQAALGQGKWVLHLTGRAPDGTGFRQRLDLWVRG